MTSNVPFSCLFVLGVVAAGCGPDTILNVDGRVSSVRGEMLGLDESVDSGPCTARVVYRRMAGDAADVDETFGRYQLDSRNALLVEVNGHRITGSGMTQLETWNTTGDNFHVADGVGVPQIGIEAPDLAPMRVDGKDDNKMQFRLHFIDDKGKIVEDDRPPSPFPYTKPRQWRLFELTRNKASISCEIRGVDSFERDN